MSPHQYVYHCVGKCCLTNQTSRRHSRKRRALRYLLSLILPDRIARRIFPGTPPTINGHSRSRATLHLDKSNVLHDVHRISTPILIDCPPESPTTLHPDKSNVLHDVHRVSTPLIPIDGSPESPAILHLDKSNVLHDLHRVSTPIPIDDPPESPATLHLDKSNVLHDLHRVNTPPILIDGPSELPETLHFDKPNVLHDVHRANTPPTPIDDPPESPATLHVDKSNVLYDVHRVNIPPILIDGRPESGTTQFFCRFRVAKLSRPETCLRSYDTRGAHRYLATLTNHHKGHGQLDHGSYNFDVIFAHHCRVCELNLHRLTRWQLKRVASAMQEKSPALVHLMLEFAGSYSRPALALPDGFLGGFAPRLQSLELRSIPFPALPKLLLSATDLVRLDLVDIPHSGYMSPEAIVTGLAMLPHVISLTLKFKSPHPSILP